MSLIFDMSMPKRTPTVSKKTTSKQLDIFNCSSNHIDNQNIDTVTENQSDCKGNIVSSSYGKIISMTTYVSADSLKQFYEQADKLTSHLD